MTREECKNYEQECTRIQKENGELIELFREELQGLAPKTIKRHCSNVDFYINDFLLLREANDFTHGVSMIDEFLGDFFIRKCMWSTPGTIKSTAASIRKFYKCMLKHGKIKEDEYQSLCDTIKEEMYVWQENCEWYNDSGAENPFLFF